MSDATPGPMPAHAAHLWRVSSARGAAALTGAAMAGFAGVTVPFGLTTGVLEWDPTAAGLGPTLAAAFVVPALAEELVFRGPLRHQPSVRRTVGLTAAYVAWHPLAAWAFLAHGRPLFFDPAFLLIVLALGSMTAALTILTGRLAPAVITHWAVVVAWKQLLGGPAVFGGAS